MKTLLIYLLLILPVFLVKEDEHTYIDLSNILIVGLLIDTLIKVVIYVVISIALNYFLADDGTDSPSAKPGVTQVPQVTASAPVPVLFGTKIIAQPNVVWYGDVGSTPWEQCYD